MDTAQQLIEAGHQRLRPYVERFSRRGDERAQVRELLEHAAARRLHDREEVDPRTRRTFERFIERRVKGEPVPYIRGYEEFLGMRLGVKPGAFVPRDSTQFLARQAIRRLRRRNEPIALDLATGVGAIALAMGRAVPAARVYGTDLSRNAVTQARANARLNRLPNVTFLAGSMFDPLPKRLRGAVDVIASHPPYVAMRELRDLPAEVIDYEPVASLTDTSRDGLGLVRLLVREGREWLRPGGWLCVEIASDLARGLRSMMVRAGYREAQSTRDGSSDSRVLVARR